MKERDGPLVPVKEAYFPIYHLPQCKLERFLVGKFPPEMFPDLEFKIRVRTILGYLVVRHAKGSQVENDKYAFNIPRDADITEVVYYLEMPSLKATEFLN